jgi:hypothetical protein
MFVPVPRNSSSGPILLATFGFVSLVPPILIPSGGTVSKNINRYKTCNIPYTFKTNILSINFPLIGHLPESFYTV